MSNMSYRNELDGVRALTMICILLFHVGYSGVRGGFVSVDVFFVLSGYLICGQTYMRLQAGDFSVAEFFGRRIRRLAPASGVCFLVLALLANAFFLRPEMQVVADNFLGSITFTNNFNLMGSAGYFAGPNAENPFLHTWTLSIEEQFYIVMPMLILLLQRDARRFAWMLGVIFVISLSLTLFSGDLIYNKDERYFSSIFRVWQIAAGGLAFLVIHYKLIPRRVPMLPLVGLTMILAPVFVIDSSFLYPFWPALFPVTGAVLLIFFSEPRHSWTGRVLACRPMVYMGKISYGTYLWHWPIIVGVIYYGTAMTDEIRAVIVVVSFILGSLSYHFVELPFRYVSVTKYKKWLFRAFAVQFTIMLGVAAYLHSQPGKAEYGENARLEQLKAQVMNTHDGWNLCWNKTTVDTFCRMGIEKDVPDYLVWGDSMANSAFPAFDRFGRERGLSGRLATSPGCAALEGVAPSQECIEINNAIFDYLDAADPMDVFIMARWSYYSKGYGSFGNVPGKVPLIYEDGTRAPENFPAFVDGLDRALARISDRHNVILINSFPKYETSIPKAMLRNLRFGADLPSLPRDVFDAREGETLGAVADLAEKYDLPLVNPHEVMCMDLDCVYAKDALPLYMDDVHLGPLGNDLFLEILNGALERPTFNLRHTRQP